MTQPASLVEVAQRARHASDVMAAASADQKNDALAKICKALEESKESLLEANREDKANAKANNLGAALQKRLDLEGSKFDTLISGLQAVQRVDDPVGKVSLARELDSGLNMYRVSCPIGVLCIIFESRPEAAVQISSLAIKSGNAVILKGGKEALASNTAIVAALRKGLKSAGLPEDAVQLVSTREQVAELLSLDDYIDLIIPRGSNSLVKGIMSSTNIPVMGHADGICHTYVDKDADEKTAIKVVLDAKTSYVAACNTTETLLVHEGASHLLPKIGEALAAKGVKMHADPASYKLLPLKNTVKATRDTFKTEYLAMEISVRVVPSLQAAIDHINVYSSHHTDAIITENGEAAEAFLQGVNSAGVYHNASTRFADGFRYGFGAEVGVSTNRIHARGPVGLEGLLIYKYRMHGHGHCSADYGVGDGKKPFTHRDIRMPEGSYAPSLSKSVSLFTLKSVLSSPYFSVTVASACGVVVGLALAKGLK